MALPPNIEKKMFENYFRIGQKFKDKWGTIWSIISFEKGQPILWSHEGGEGLWDSGRGLIKI